MSATRIQVPRGKSEESKRKKGGFGKGWIDKICKFNINYLSHLLFTILLRSRVPQDIFAVHWILSAAYVDGRRSFPRALSRCSYKQRLSESLSPAVKLCGRASICDPFYDYSEFLYVICGLLKFLCTLNRVIIYECASVGVWSIDRARSIYVVPRTQQYINYLSIVYIFKIYIFPFRFISLIVI